MSQEITVQEISRRILIVRGHRVMLDSDLAKLYGVETGALNRAVKRNLNRFPEDFMFLLSNDENEKLKHQFGTSIFRSTRGGRRKLPMVFTEQGIAMLSSVLRSEEATLVNIEIMRAFVQLRQFLLTNQQLSKKLFELENKYDAKFREVFDAIRSLMIPPETKRRKIGIRSDPDE